MTTDRHQIVLCTCPDQPIATSIAEKLITARLAACVNILPKIHSIYEWKGKIEQDEEVLLIIKTRSDSYTQLEHTIRAMHPYELPEIITVSIEKGLKDYLRWIDSTLDQTTP